MITEKENFISLLYYFGLITFTGKIKESEPCLRIPNETIKQIVFEYIKTTLREGCDLQIDSDEIYPLLKDLAYKGIFKPAFKFVAKKIHELTSIDDSKSGEIVPKIFYLIYFSQNSLFLVTTEQEMNKGKADMVMIPNPLYKGLKYAYLIEFKYIKKSVSDKMLPKILEKTVAKAQTQLEKYSADEKFLKSHKIQPYGKIKLKTLIVVFHGWKLVHLSLQ
jgi:hypothetical protein